MKSIIIKIPVTLDVIIVALAPAPLLTLGVGCLDHLSALLLGFVREESGSVLAPDLLHGLPQATAPVMVQFL